MLNKWRRHHKYKSTLISRGRTIQYYLCIQWLLLLYQITVNKLFIWRDNSWLTGVCFLNVNHTYYLHEEGAVAKLIQVQGHDVPGHVQVLRVVPHLQGQTTPMLTLSQEAFKKLSNTNTCFSCLLLGAT